MSLPFRLLADGIELRVRARPKASREAVEGCVPDAAGEPWLSVRVTAPADGGKANAAILRLLARRIGLPVSRLSLVAGSAARLKRIRIEGEPEELAARLEALVGRG